MQAATAEPKGVEEAGVEIEHVLVPRHEVISDSEAKELLERLGIKIEQLPKIFVSDPAIRHLNPKIGNIIKISRNSATAGTTTYYRIVIESENIAEGEE